MSQTLLVAFDYGQGRLWAYVQAESAEAIEEKFPELQVFRRPPDWMTPNERATLQTYDLDEEPRPQ